MEYMSYGGLFLTLELSLGWNDTFTMSHGLTILSSYKSKILNLNWIADPSGA